MKGMKGADPLLSAVMMILLTVTIATIVSGWLTATSEQTGKTIRNQTKERLSCNYAHLYIRNVTYNCSDNCSADNNHNLTIELVNSGEVAFEINNLYIRNTTGTVFQLSISRTKFSASDVKYLTNISREACDGINNTIEYVTISSMNCPSNAYDNYPGNLVNFVNC
ncbi:MAG: hypothetical protein V1900_02235 [Candidatus Aenigmatarchaeota archaeon]